MRILNLIADGYPTTRPDVSALFGRYLPRLGIHTDLVTHASAATCDGVAQWRAGRAIVCRLTGLRSVDQLRAFSHDVRVLWRVRAGAYDALQVRDKVFAAAVAVWIARRRGLPIFYWMSYPVSDGFLQLAQDAGPSVRLARRMFWMLKGHLGRIVLYRYVLPRCTGVFVQSDRMLDDVAARGIPRQRLTAVPMGVDLERPIPPKQGAFTHLSLQGRRVVAYLGSLERSRRLDFLLEVVQQLTTVVPDVALLMIGDSALPDARQWLEQCAVSLGIAERTVWTGWVPPDDAWRWLAAADVAVSIVPRGTLYDCSSPTKVIEYMALGIPVVANDSPDQKSVLDGSGAGICTPMHHEAFVTALRQILSSADLAQRMRAAGPRYVATHRGYDRIAGTVAAVYRSRVGAT